MSMSASSAQAKLVVPVGEFDHVRGPETAPVTLVEYGDFECSYCRAAYDILKQVEDVMGDDLRFAFRHFPLTQVHPHAETAAEAAEGAGAQGRFWEMHNVLFENQERLDRGHLTQYANKLGIDAVRLAIELQKHVYHDRVRGDFSNGVKSGVNGTPAFFINGFRYDGSWEFDPLVNALAEAKEAQEAIFDSQ